MNKNTDSVSLESPGVSPQPAWLELPEKAEYWVCTGTNLAPSRRWWQRQKPLPNAWVLLFYSKEDAESHATLPNRRWKWNGGPAQSFSLAETMFDARSTGCLGVQVRSFQDGAWRTVKEYPAGQPLPEVER